MRNLALFAAALIACTFFATAHAQAPAQPPDDRAARIPVFFDGAVGEAIASGHVAGVVVAAIDRDRVVMVRGYGQAGPGRGVDADTLFRVGSISKTLVWIAIMQLVEEGKLSLDDPINDHLPPALRIPEDGYRAPIRVRHLMTHSAGFEDSQLGHLFLLDPARVQPLEAYLVHHRVRRVRPPGTLSVYSNYAAELAGALVAHESGMDWPTYAERRILRPLGMVSATFREPYSVEIAAAHRLPAPMPAEVAARVAQGYRFRAGQLEPTPFEYITQVGPAASLSASANDMVIYMQALLNPARMAQAGVLNEDDARSLREPIFANYEGLGAWRHGFLTVDLGSGQWAYGHFGTTEWQESLLLVSPALRSGLFISCNSRTGGGLVGQLATAFGREFNPLAHASERNTAAKNEAARYAGTYRVLRRPYNRTERAYGGLAVAEITAVENGDLILAAGGAQRFIPLGGGLYENVTDFSRVAFREDGGRMHFYDSLGFYPMERVGFFESPRWLALIASLGAFVALWGVIAGARRILVRRESAAALVFDGLCLIWLAAFALLAAALLPWAGPDDDAISFEYPGELFPIACWGLAGAALATLIAAPLAVFLVRPKDWSWLRWTRAGACVAAFATLSLTLWNWGLLGFSGF